jgi:Holliday junction DNA helicase RuvA
MAYFRIIINFNSMYDYIKGKKSSLQPDHVVIDINGLGYLLHISLHTHAGIKELDHPLLYTHLHVREDQMELYGFSSEFERSLFRLLITVSGIGTNTARLICSSLSPDEIRSAILSGNVAIFKNVKGIGVKTAQRIILDLKDKVLKDHGQGGVTELLAVPDKEMEEAFNALVALGFQRSQIRKALNKVVSENGGNDSTENLIKMALKIMT